MAITSSQSNFPGDTSIVLGARAAGHVSLYKADEPSSTHAKKSTVVAHVVYLLVAGFAFLALAYCLYATIKVARVEKAPRHHALTGLSIGIYTIQMLFVVSATVMQFGVGIGSTELCHWAIVLCLAFYFASKMLIYAFLVERAHSIEIIRGRLRNVAWLVGMICLVVGTGTIAIIAFVDPVYNVSQHDAQCRIGIPVRLTVALLVYDIFMNVGLTFYFLVMIRPFLHGKVLPGWLGRGVSRFVALWAPSKAVSNQGPQAVIRRSNERRVLERLAIRSFWAGFAILIGTLVNLTVLVKFHGEEEGWVCFTTCIADVAWSALVIFLMMRRSGEATNATQPSTGLPAPISRAIPLSSVVPDMESRTAQWEAWG